MPKCQKCDITFLTKKALHDHNVKSHIGNNFSWSNLNKDIPKHQNANGKEGYGFKCAMCGANFKRKSELDIHVTAVHGGTAIY